MNCQSNKNTQEKHYCRYCCHPFTTERGLNKHYDEGCKTFDGQNFKLPDKGSFIAFQKYNTKLECPFVIYGDFECLTVNSNEGIKGTYGEALSCSGSNDPKGTYQEHKPCGYMLNVVNRIDKTSQPYLYRGENCMDKFVEQLSEIKNDIFSRMNVDEPMDITDEQELEFRKATRC